MSEVKLPRGVTRRARRHGTSYLVSFTDQHGDLQQVTYRDRREAIAAIAAFRGAVSAGTYVSGSRATPGTTLADYAARYFRTRTHRSREDDETRFRLHVAPHLGAKRLEALRHRDVIDWIEGLRRAAEMSAKSILNAHGVLHRMLEEAIVDELIAVNPAKLPRGKLPRRSRKPGARFDREEVAALAFDLRVQADRRVLWALAGLAGLRLGEASGRRWRDLDVDAPELAALRVATQYDDAPLKTARDDDTHERIVPVHPTLAALFARWWAEGWSTFYGRPPTSEDWICPDPITMAPSTKNRGTKACYRDCATLGIPRRGPHALRRAMISLARSDGARPDVLERVTHNARGEMIDVYTSFEWRALCEAVAALQLDAQLDASADHRADQWRRRESKPARERRSAAFPGVAGNAAVDVEALDVEESRPRLACLTRVKHDPQVALLTLRAPWDAMEISLAREAGDLRPSA